MITPTPLPLTPAQCKMKHICIWCGDEAQGNYTIDFNEYIHLCDKHGGTSVPSLASIEYHIIDSHPWGRRWRASYLAQRIQYTVDTMAEGNEPYQADDGIYWEYVLKLKPMKWIWRARRTING